MTTISRSGCYQFARDYGWPKGPINAFSLWNEPWEGISISGWGADMLRYREMYTHMYQGVAQARQNDGAQVLVGGCDSSSNAMDKLFPDGTNTMLPMFDFLSIHYQGLTSMATVKDWVNRKGSDGRVKIWDTESWVANTDDRVAAVVAGDRAAGYDRAMGVFGGNICDEQDVDMRLPDGKTRAGAVVHAWSTAASVGATPALHRRAPLLAAAVPERPALGDAVRRPERQPRRRHGRRRRRLGRRVRRGQPALPHGARLRRASAQGGAAGSSSRPCPPTRPPPTRARAANAD